tara:strand:- start:180 stop:404 length:225 start_codon:yes stop_codon:yes gene_type:complete
MDECYDCSWYGDGTEWRSHEQVTNHETNSEDWYVQEDYDDYDDGMDGDHQSALASAGWGTDEDYGYYGDDPYEY